MRRNRKNIYSNDVKDRKKLKNVKTLKNAKWIFKLIGKIFVCFSLLFMILFSILVIALTVYVMKATETETTISLEKNKIIGSEYTNVYGRDEKGKEVKLSVIDCGIKRLWVDIADVPQNVKDAVVCVEDHNFYKHDGVDFRRTAGAVLNMFLHFWARRQGGSTITQQLLKNVTGERDVRGLKGISRKVREICGAMSLERKYSKDQILQAYLNIIYFGHGNHVGIKTAAKLYYNKDIKDINIEEAASLASLIQNPGKYDMLKNPAKIVNRRNYALNRMYELGKITKQECEESKKKPVKPHKGNIYRGKSDDVQSYFVDCALNEVVSEYMKQNNISDWDKANDKVKKSGLKIYTTIDVDMQTKLEKEYEKLKFAKNIQSAFVIFDLNGNMKACVGGLGKKPPGDRACVNYAKTLMLPGSTVKAFVYANAIENNKITYSSLFKDAPFKEVEGKMWPENFGNKHSDDMVTIKTAVEKSLNTVPTKILYDGGNKGIINFCDFLTDKLNISHIENPKNPSKKGRFETSAMAMGSLTNGVYLTEFTNAFQIFANGGKLRQGTTLEKVYSQSGEEFINLNKKTTRAISKDTSVVVNRLLRNVVLGGGTGAAANLDSSSIEVFGKTGTSNDGRNILFIGGTPNYVAGIWFGTTNGKEISKSVVDPANVWKNIMKKLLENKKSGSFALAAAKEQTYCAKTGLLANKSCPKKEKGYYKRDNFLTKQCTIHH